MRRFWPAAAVAVAVSFVSAGSASAGQIVFERGDELGGSDIWVMNDDGTGKRELVARSDTPTFVGANGTLVHPSELGSPHVDPRGGTVVFDGYYDSIPTGVASGSRAVGLYKLEGGVVSRLSFDPSPTADISHFESEPEATGDGRVIFSNWLCVWTSIICSTHIDTQSLDDTAADGDVDTRQEYGSECDDEISLGSPSPNPVNPNRVAYVGCDAPGFGDVDQLIVGGPGGTNAVVVDTDGYEFKDPSWRPDGAKIVVVQQDDAPGIYTYNPDGSGERRVLIADRFAVGSPRYVGNGRIIFELAHGGGYDIFSIPATCNPCTTADATRLTFNGDSGAPAWTSVGGLGLPPELRVANVTVDEELRATSSARFIVRRTGGLPAATVDFRTVQGTATSPADYATRRGTLSFAEGQASKAISVPIAGDALDELNEKFTLRLSSPTGGARLADGEAVATIVDDDPAPRASVEDLSLFEGDAGTVSVRFNVRLSAISGRTVTVAYATSDGTARQPSDYSSRAGTLSFDPGQRLKTVAVSVRGDTRVEPNERFWLTLTSAVGAQLGDALASALIKNDD